MMVSCPCGTNQEYLSCCGLYINKDLLADSPEKLMRSRYSAYTLGKIAYIQKTMRGKALLGFNPKDAARWSRHVKWLGLRVLKVTPEDENRGFVEFIASFEDSGILRSIHEVSEFEKINDCWFYIDGIQLL